MTLAAVLALYGIAALLLWHAQLTGSFSLLRSPAHLTGAQASLIQRGWQTSGGWRLPRQLRPSVQSCSCLLAGAGVVQTFPHDAPLRHRSPGLFSRSAGQCSSQATPRQCMPAQACPFVQSSPPDTPVLARASDAWAPAAGAAWAVQRHSRDFGKHPGAGICQGVGLLRWPVACHKHPDMHSQAGKANCHHCAVMQHASATGSMAL